jgi:hypothetical protein
MGDLAMVIWGFQNKTPSPKTHRLSYMFIGSNTRLKLVSIKTVGFD